MVRHMGRHMGRHVVRHVVRYMGPSQASPHTPNTTIWQEQPLDGALFCTALPIFPFISDFIFVSTQVAPFSHIHAHIHHQVVLLFPGVTPTQSTAPAATVATGLCPHAPIMAQTSMLFSGLSYTVPLDSPPRHHSLRWLRCAKLKPTSAHLLCTNIPRYTWNHTPFFSLFLLNKYRLPQVGV